MAHNGESTLATVLIGLIGAVFGAGGVKMFQIWLENRRLSKKEFRETLMDRVRELEAVVSRLQKRVETLVTEVAHLEAENTHLKRELEHDDAESPRRNEGTS